MKSTTTKRTCCGSWPINWVKWKLSPNVISNMLEIYWHRNLKSPYNIRRCHRIGVSLIVSKSRIFENKMEVNNYKSLIIYSLHRRTLFPHRSCPRASPLHLWHCCWRAVHFGSWGSHNAPDARSGAFICRLFPASGPKRSPSNGSAGYSNRYESTLYL